MGKNAKNGIYLLILNISVVSSTCRNLEKVKTRTKKEIRMSNAKHREEETHVSASHLATSSSADDDEWGDVTPKSKSDLDRILEEDHDEEEEVETTTTVAVQEMAKDLGSLDPSVVIAQIEQLRTNLPAAIQALTTELEAVSAERTRLDEKENDIKNRINLIRALGGQGAVSTVTSSTEAPKKRGPGRPKKNPGDATTGEKTKTKPGKRLQNEQTLKEVILKVLFRMVHPTSGKLYTGFVTEIKDKALAEEGYKSNSGKPENIVRVHLYRLEEDGKVIKNEDNSWSLRKTTIKEMGGTI